MGRKGFTISELLVVFTIVIIIGCVLAPFVQYSRHRMDKITCTNNLRELGLGLYIYAREHAGEFPTSMQTLYDEDYLADKSLMDCPGTGIEGTPEASDYIYTAGLSVRGPSLEILVKDKGKNHLNAGRNVLLVNGTVAWRAE
ncbi:MAG: type II secretion system protein [Candidatus Tantalella remota]|nr:type II secretion system protein [Candidatus Tantalella remota]